MLRIIDNKRIDLTDAEWKLYQDICKSYDGPHMQGKDLFEQLFETDKNGIIVFLRPPTGRYSSMEVYMFLVGVMVHQHLGTACDHVDNLAKVMGENLAILNEKMAAVDNLLSKGNELLNSIESSREP